MNIIITANTSWYLFNFRQNTIKELLNDGHNVTAIAPKDEYSPKLQALGCEWFDINIDQSGTNPIRDFSTFINFYKTYRSLKPAFVLNFTPKNNIYSTLAASLLDIYCINNIAGLGKLFVEQTIASKIAKFLYKLSQNRASKVFFQNEEDRALFIESNIVTKNITERLFGSGIDLKRFTLNVSQDDGIIRFLLVARLLKQKGIYQYAQAAKQLRSKFGLNVEFRLLGFLDECNPNSILKADLDTWVNEGYINYLGVSDCVENEIEQVDCMVLPSFYREGVPKSLLEGLGSGKAIITTDNIGCRETVEDGINGYLCEPQSVESLIVQLTKFINLDFVSRNAMGQNSRKLAESKFDEKIVIDSYKRAIKEIAENTN
jgi:glycosyltransferase involved in cell wall biosynthesis